MPKLTYNAKTGDFEVIDPQTGKTVAGYLDVQTLPPAGGQRRCGVQFVAKDVEAPAPGSIGALLRGE